MQNNYTIRYRESGDTHHDTWAEVRRELHRFIGHDIVGERFHGDPIDWQTPPDLQGSVVFVWDSDASRDQDYNELTYGQRVVATIFAGE